MEKNSVDFIEPDKQNKNTLSLKKFFYVCLILCFLRLLGKVALKSRFCSRWDGKKYYLNFIKTIAT